MLNRSSNFRARLAIVLTVLVLFFGVALFSALHQHTAGVCSLDNLEHQIVSLAEAAVVITPTSVPLKADIPQDAVQPAIGHTLSARGRAPPSIS